MVLQLVLTEQVAPLRALKGDYGIQCVVTDAVDGELRRKLQNKFPAKANVYKKALANGTILLLSDAVLNTAGYKAAPALMDQIEQLGREYAVRVDRGEAYTHAASNVLCVPALSQDLAALWKLVELSIHVQRPILRAFDLLIFGLQIGVITESDTKAFRKALLSHDQGLLPCFRNCAVIDGLPSFYQRLCDSSSSPLGAAKPLEKFDDRIWITRLAQAASGS